MTAAPPAAAPASAVQDTQVCGVPLLVIVRCAPWLLDEDLSMMQAEKLSAVDTRALLHIPIGGPAQDTKTHAGDRAASTH